MLTRRRLILAVVAPALAVPLGCGRGNGVKLMLRYHPPAGVTYHYSLDQHTDMKFAGGPMGQVPEQKITMRMQFTQMVTGPTEGGTGMTVTFDSTSMDSPLMETNAYKPVLDRMRGLTSHVVYDERMNVVRAEFVNTTGALSPIAEQLGKSLKGMTFPLPQDSVGVGDSWTALMELPINQVASGGAPMSATTKLTVKEIHADGPDTTVLIALETAYPGEPFKVLQQGQMLTLKLSGNMAGDQLFSVSRGAVVRSQIGGAMQIKMTGGMLGADGTNMSMKQTTTLQLGEAK